MIPRTTPARPSPNARWLGALERTARIGADPLRTLPRIVTELADLHGAAPALVGPGGDMSFRALGETVARYARWAREQDVRAGDVVGLFAPNRTDYMAAWLGISQVGGVAALVNANLAGASLVHCLDLVRPKHVIVASALSDAFASVLPRLALRPRIWLLGEGDLGEPIAGHLAGLDGRPLGPNEAPALALGDTALLIYTSGTTNLPKAARISHHRVLAWSEWFAGLLGTGPDDRMYDVLPMYHSVGGIVATGATLLGGGTVVVRERFSAGSFWDDVARERCTLFQYIGELCRFLLASPEHPLERSHRLRIATGNGLRPDIWEAFRDRFAIPEILEFYAATESTISLYNVEGRVGAVGRVPPLMRHRSPAALIRVDPETGAPERGPDGLCVPAGPGEVGELVGRISDDPARLAERFEGYTEADESDRKLLRDVERPADRWFRSGDLMRQDAAGFFYFVDRTGETFRWRGENVSAGEVSEVIRSVPGIRDVAVYGVAVPGQEGRVGMAAIVIGPGFTWAGFRDALAADLPGYARPLFVRVCDALERTDTFKVRIGALARAGYDPRLCRDPVYVADASPDVFRPLGPADLEPIGPDGGGSGGSSPRSPSRLAVPARAAPSGSRGQQQETPR